MPSPRNRKTTWDWVSTSAARISTRLAQRRASLASPIPGVGFLQTHEIRSTRVLAHMRKATVGVRALRNTHPSVRELGGRTHVFLHNGKLAGIEDDGRFQLRRFRPIGETNSELAFCALLHRTEKLWQASELPSLDARLDAVAAFAAELRTLSPRKLGVRSPRVRSSCCERGPAGQSACNQRGGARRLRSSRRQRGAELLTPPALMAFIRASGSEFPFGDRDEAGLGLPTIGSRRYAERFQ